MVAMGWLDMQPHFSFFTALTSIANGMLRPAARLTPLV